MVRIGTLKPRLAQPSARLQVATRVVEGDRTRPVWHGWYKTAAWGRLRWQVLERDLFTCRMCGRAEADTSRLVADHRVPHLGDPALFSDPDNLQCLCKTCHDGRKQRDDRRG